MLCPSCNQDRHQGGRFSYTCGNASCHATLGPVNQGSPAPAPRAATVPASQGAPPLPVPSQAPAGQIPTALPVGGYVEQMRARLKVLDEALGPLNEEREFLRKMLSATDKREKRGRKNVIPLTRANNA